MVPTAAKPASAEELSAVEVTTLELLNAEVSRRLDGQHSEIGQLDTKAGSLLAGSVAVTGFLLAGQRNWATVIAVLGHTAVFLAALGALSVRSWSQAPSPDALLAVELRSREQVYDFAFRAKVLAFSQNSEKSKAKSDWVKISTWLLVIALILSAVATIV